MKSFYIFLLVLPSILVAQKTDVNSSIINGATNVYIDNCWDCNDDNFRREVNYVNFMRTRQDADVYILVTSQDVSSGGEKHILYFNGQKMPYLGIVDTLIVYSKKDDTGRIISDNILRCFKKGIIPYVLKSELSDNIDFVYIGDTNSVENNNISKETIDPWNSWVFSIRGRGHFNGESSYNGLFINGNLSANRITEENKISIRSGLRYSKNNYHLINYDSIGVEVDRESFSSFSRSQYGSAEYVKSLTNHWSAGLNLNVRANTFSNLNLGSSIKIGAEYNYYQYSKSDRQSLSFLYKIGPVFNNYVDTTIYNKKNELLWQQNLSINFLQKQNWGTVYLGLSYSGYLHDFELYNLSFNPNIDWNIVKGLTFGLGGYFSLIGDQITLPKGDVNIPDLLLKNRILSTKYSYWGFFNIRYTFGSEYNNIVNPRYEGGN